MKKKPELDDVDVVFDPTPLTEAEKKLISEYIQQHKAKREKNKISKKQKTASKQAEVKSSK
jgi:hypothetical protein